MSNYETTENANSVFEQPWWLNIVANGKWGEVFVKDGDTIIARLPYVLDKRHIKMPLLTQTLGPWIKPEYHEFLPGNTQLSRQKEIVGELFSQLPKHKSFNMTFDSSNDYILPCRWLGYHYIPTFSYRIGLTKDTESIYADFNKTVKKNIKYASNKTEIFDDANVDGILLLLDKTFERQRRSVPGDSKLKRQLMNEAICRGNGKIIIASDNTGNLHSGAFLLYDKNICYYLVGGSDPRYRNSGAQSLVIWKSIQFAATVSKIFDFEGSNVEGIENFFRQFGGVLITNYNVVKQSVLADCADIIKPRIKKIIGYKL